MIASLGESLECSARGDTPGHMPLFFRESIHRRERPHLGAETGAFIFKKYKG